MRIAVDQTRLRIADVAFLDNAAAQCAVSVCARDAVINDNEPGSVQKSAPGES